MAAADPDRLEAEDDLLRAAHAALELAYAPHTGRAFGAALLSPGGEVFTACNLEHADQRLAQCAERAALARAVAAGEREFLALALAGSDEAAPRPCRDCCAVLAEHADDLWVVSEGRGEGRLRTTLLALGARNGA